MFQLFTNWGPELLPFPGMKSEELPPGPVGTSRRGNWATSGHLP